jgi:hypothetical protein
MGDSRYSFSILDFGIRWKLVVSYTPGRFTPREGAPGTHSLEAGWAPEQVWALWSREKSLATLMDMFITRPGEGPMGSR